jgi:Ca2+-transporting ATPase
MLSSESFLSAESLGATTVICSDKTGTLTKGEMTVRRIYNSGRLIEVTGVGYEPKGEFYLGGQPINPHEDEDLSLLLTAGALCSNAVLKNENGVWRVIGDPTEGALVAAAAKAGLEKDKLEKIYPRIWEGVFTSERKRMSTVHMAPGERD